MHNEKFAPDLYRKSRGNNFIYDTVESTNSSAREIFFSGEGGHGTLVAANCQTNGRGRLGREFYSPQDTGIYMSVILEPRETISPVTMITSAAAVAVCDAIVELVPTLDPRIKWVNDILIGGKKVCGILAEGMIPPGCRRPVAIIVGIGINCQTSVFPSEIAGIAGSLGAAVSRSALCARVCDRLLEICENIDDGTMIESYRARSAVLGKRVRCFGGGRETIYGKVVSICDDSALLIEGDDGKITKMSSGEISLRLEE